MFSVGARRFPATCGQQSCAEWWGYGHCACWSSAASETVGEIGKLGHLACGQTGTHGIQRHLYTRFWRVGLAGNIDGGSGDQGTHDTGLLVGIIVHVAACGLDLPVVLSRG